MTKEEALFKVEGLLTDYLPVEDYNTVVEIMEALKREPCEDAISRQAVLDLINSDWKYEGLETDVANLPSVTPQPRIGHWIEHQHEWGDNWQYSKYECSDCHNWANFDEDFCPNCGAKIVESEE